MNIANATVYIVEDDPSFRKSMERLIRASGYEAMAFESAYSFLAEDSVTHPGCLLLDIRLPDIDGFLLQQKLQEKGDRFPVVFMTGHGTIPQGVQAMKKGAVDFLTKPFEPQDLLKAIQEALEIDTQKMEEEFEKHNINSLIDTLTPREKEILRWIITGRPNKQIALNLAISEKTVKIHRSRVMQKLKVSSVAEIVRLAQKANISPED